MKNIKIIILLLMILLYSGCDVLIKKNEEDFTKKENNFYYISFSNMSETFAGYTQFKFACSIDKKHIYAYNNQANSAIQVFNVNNQEGQIFYIRTLITNRMHLALSGDNKYLYSTDGGNIVYVYEIKDDGGIKYISEISLVNLTAIRYITVSPNGKFLYLAGNYNAVPSIICYDRDIESGKLKFSNYFNLSASSNKLIFSPDFRHLYAVLDSSFDIQWYKIDADSGSLTYINYTDLALNISDCIISENGKFIYASYNTNQIQLYKRNADTGNLTFDSAGFTDYPVNSIMISPDDNFLFAVTYTGAASAIEWFMRSNDTGRLQNRMAIDNNALNNPYCLNFSAQGNYLFVLSVNNSQILSYKINSD